MHRFAAALATLATFATALALAAAFAAVLAAVLSSATKSPRAAMQTRVPK